MSGLASPGSLERAQVDFSFTEPRFLDRNLAAGFDLFHKEVDFTNVASYRERNTGGNLRMGFPIAFNTQLGLRYRFEREEIYDVADNASLAVKAGRGRSPSYRASASPSPTIRATFRNRRPSGIFASFSRGFRRRRRRRELFQVGRRRSRLLSGHAQDHLGRPRSGRLHRGMGRRGRPHDRPLLQGWRNHQRLRARRYRPARRLRKRHNWQAREGLQPGPAGRTGLLGHDRRTSLPASLRS